jgi:lipoprotein-anchoring transpeptidase ErfK/SrfK
MVRRGVLFLVCAALIPACSSPSIDVALSGRSSPSPLPYLAPYRPPSRPGSSSCGKAPTLIATVTSPVVTARISARASGKVIGRFPKVNLQGSPQVFDVVSEVDEGGAAAWYRVLLPLRPNGTLGFVRSRDVRLSETPYAIYVDERHLELTLWSGCTRSMTFDIGLGKDATPTPRGRYYIASLLKPPSPDTVYGVYAYGLSAYSDAIRDWAGGGIIGIHGTNDPSSIGHRKSHGCIRMRNRDISTLVPILPLGTPVIISK